MKPTVRYSQLMLISASAFFLHACEQATPPATESIAVEPADVTSVNDAAATVTALADRYYAITLKRTPETAYFSGVELPRHDGMEDNSPAARQTAEAEVDEMLRELELIDAETLTGKTE